ncbi:hypothetical protein MNEG_7760 [Monoraphidium neglectum]|uniref:Uncharacterized protein n=1 Tax=Monoraphidium neglectum TaxID=145388 RepID=A0A0D2N1U7_9CHLO|nr:hypothetical protein MNEG_7760 [Monoraphidium neglectum]KIZ00201.1 hypothetical protein MNEG_7760 [Monoraphidium neglectum]|eukprot:XP_013899220.1 hypothetical protein MNEG_7760 [Monoraphidium neglectum]
MGMRGLVRGIPTLETPPLLLFMQSDEAAWYWGPIGAAAAAEPLLPATSAAAAASAGPGAAASASADADGPAVAAALSRRVREADSPLELLELALEEGPRLSLGDVRRLLLRLCDFYESGGASGFATVVEPQLLSALQQLQLAAAARLQQQPGGGAAAGGAPPPAAAGEVASVVWCLAEFEGSWWAEAAASQGVTSGADATSDGCAAGVEGRGGGFRPSGFARPEFLEAVSHWVLGLVQAPTSSGSSSDGNGRKFGAKAAKPLAGTDGVSMVWGFGRLLGTCLGAAPAIAAAAMDELCRVVADDIDASTAVAPAAAEDLTDLADGVAAAGRRSAASAKLLDAVAHEVYRQLSNRHSGSAGFRPSDLVKLVNAYARAGYGDGNAPRMLDAVASYVVQRVRKQHLNAVSRPADLSGLVAAFADLRHTSVAVPELIRAVTQQARRVPI